MHQGQKALNPLPIYLQNALYNLSGHSTEWRKYEFSYSLCDRSTSSTIHTDEWHIIIVVNELRWLSQENDYELDEWIVFLSMETIERHACQE
jgi:hypothetical protein